MVQPKQESMPDAPIRILHLSDVHFRVGKRWDAEPVTRALARFINAEVASGLVPDLVVFSGDLAFSGAAEEYALARDWLENELWPALPEGPPRDRLLLVPGNHDVDRRKISRGVRAMQDGLLAARTQDEVAALLSDEHDRNNMLRRHAAYMDFVAGWYGKPQLLPWWQRMVEIRGTRLHITGLDTAWMSCGDDDRSRLLLGRYQLTQTVGTQEADDTAWRIAVLHHPWEYLAEFDHHPSRSAVHQHCDLLLRGHLHQPLSERVSPPDPSRQCLELAAGCVYEHSQYENAFQWIELSPTGKRIRVRFCAWLHNAWTIDRNQPNCPDGHANFELDARPTDRGSSQGTMPSLRTAPKLGRLYGDVPNLPLRYVERPEHLDAIVAKILRTTAEEEGLPGVRTAMALQGMGGVGKTVLAGAAVRDDRIRQAFPRGIYWITVGQTPDISDLQRRLLAWLDPRAPTPTSIQDGRDALDTTLKSCRCRCLIVLDDVWQSTHIEPFELVDTPSRILFTTRDKSIVRTVAGVPHVVEELTTPAARAFLAQAVGLAEADLPPRAAEVIKECGRLPLALALAGAAIADAPQDEALWRDVLAALAAADHEQLSHEFGYPYPTHSPRSRRASTSCHPKIGLPIFSLRFSPKTSRSLCPHWRSCGGSLVSSCDAASGCSSTARSRGAMSMGRFFSTTSKAISSANAALTFKRLR